MDSVGPDLYDCRQSLTDPAIRCRTYDGVSRKHNDLIFIAICASLGSVAGLRAGCPPAAFVVVTGIVVVAKTSQTKERNSPPDPGDEHGKETRLLYLPRRKRPHSCRRAIIGSTRDARRADVPLLVTPLEMLGGTQNESEG